jgi:hypothetical protein
LPRNGGWNANFEGWLRGLGPVGVAIEEGEDGGYEADPEGAEMEGGGCHFSRRYKFLLFESDILFPEKSWPRVCFFFI